MWYSYQLKRICGAVHTGGDVAFGASGGDEGGRETLYSAVGNRVHAFSLDEQRTEAFPFECRTAVARLVVSRGGGLLLIVDTDGCGATPCDLAMISP